MFNESRNPSPTVYHALDNFARKDYLAAAVAGHQAATTDPLVSQAVVRTARLYLRSRSAPYKNQQDQESNSTTVSRISTSKYKSTSTLSPPHPRQSRLRNVTSEVPTTHNTSPVPIQAEDEKSILRETITELKRQLATMERKLERYNSFAVDRLSPDLERLTAELMSTKEQLISERQEREHERENLIQTLHDTLKQVTDKSQADSQLEEMRLQKQREVEMTLRETTQLLMDARNEVEIGHARILTLERELEDAKSDMDNLRYHWVKQKAEYETLKESIPQNVPRGLMIDAYVQSDEGGMEWFESLSKLEYKCDQYKKDKECALDQVGILENLVHSAQLVNTDLLRQVEFERLSRRVESVEWLEAVERWKNMYSEAQQRRRVELGFGQLISFKNKNKVNQGRVHDIIRDLNYLESLAQPTPLSILLSTTFNSETNSSQQQNDTSKDIITELLPTSDTIKPIPSTSPVNVPPLLISHDHHHHHSIVDNSNTVFNEAPDSQFSQLSDPGHKSTITRPNKALQPQPQPQPHQLPSYPPFIPTPPPQPPPPSTQTPSFVDPIASWSPTRPSPLSRSHNQSCASLNRTFSPNRHSTASTGRDAKIYQSPISVVHPLLPSAKLPQLQSPHSSPSVTPTNVLISGPMSSFRQITRK